MIYSLFLSLLFVIEGAFRVKVVGIRNISQMDVLYNILGFFNDSCCIISICKYCSNIFT